MKTTADENITQEEAALAVLAPTEYYGVETRSLYLFGEINEDNLAPYIDQIMAMYAMSPSEPIALTINSQGGSVSDAFGLIDLLRMIPCPIHTIAAGVVCSAAFDIFLAGDLRSSFPNTTFLMHPLTAQTGGNSDDIRRNASYYAELETRTNAWVRSRLKKMPIKEWRRISGCEYYFFPEEAVAIGAVHNIIPHQGVKSWPEGVEVRV